MEVNMKSFYFTLAKNQVNHYNNEILDCNVIIQIDAINQEIAREKMFSLFKDNWNNQYEILPDIHFFEKGIKKIN